MMNISFSALSALIVLLSVLNSIFASRLESESAVSNKTKSKGIKPIDYDEKSILSPCLVQFSEKYYRTKRKSRGSLIIVNVVEGVTSTMQKDILRDLNEDKNHTFGIMVKDGKKPHMNAVKFGVTDKAKSYMMLMKNLDDLEHAIEQWRSLPTWNPNAQTVVVALRPMLTLYEKRVIVKKALHMLLEAGIIYANVVYYMEKRDDILTTETWFPYSGADGNRCAENIEHKDIVKIDDCFATKNYDEDGNFLSSSTEYQSYNDEKFPKLPLTFHDCQLNVSTFIWEPFVVANKENKIESGLEVTMLDSITKQMKLKINYIILDKELAAKKISNDNQTGIYADLIQKRSDVILGGLYENPISRQLTSSSIPYFQDDITWCVSKAGLSPTWMNVFIIFNVWTWMGLVITLFAISFVLFWLAKVEGKYKGNYVWALITTLGFSTFQYAHYWPKRNRVKIFMALVFFYGLHINTAYQSSLIKVLTNPRYEAQIDSVKKGIENELSFHVAENTEVFFEKDDEISKYLQTNHKICSKIDECFSEILTDKSKAIAISRAHASNNPGGMKENVDFFCFPVSDDVVIYSAVMMFRRHHPLLLPMNEKIRAIAESGLLSKWEKEKFQKAETSSSSKNNDDENVATDGDGNKQMKLRLDHVQGAFLLLLIGLTISFVAFLFELFTSRLRAKANKKNPSNKFFIIFERLFCHA